MGAGYLELPAIDSRLWIEWGPRGLRRARFCPAGASVADAFGDEPPEQGAVPVAYASALGAYFAGEPVDLAALPVDLEGTEFQHKVWRALLKIPRGRVRTYASIAGDVGSPRAMRAVGAANGKNPLPVVVPCHRVVEAGMQLGGYSGGLHVKRYLLELEGVKVVGDGVHVGQLELI